MGDVRTFPRNVNRVVIKVGTSTLTDPDTGFLNDDVLNKLAKTLSDLKDQNLDVILVTSGAVGAGLKRLEEIGQKLERPLTIPQKQLAASVGQSKLIVAYDCEFINLGKAASQVLVQASDFKKSLNLLKKLGISNKKSPRENLKECFDEILTKDNVIPIVNENDTVATKELEVIGDNDTLSALVSELVDADLLVILSDIDGLYDKDPNIEKDAVLIPEVKNPKKYLGCAKGSASDIGTGGMKTKIEAADFVTRKGINMIIASGNNICSLPEIIKGEKIGTFFPARIKEKSKTHIALEFMKRMTQSLSKRKYSRVR